MTNIKNNLIFGLKVLGLFVFMGAAFSASAYVTPASYEYCDGCQPPAPKVVVDATPSPVIFSLSPSSTNVNSNLRTVTVIGSGFIPSSISRWNSSDRPTTFIDSTHLLMQLNGSDIAIPGKYLVTVVNPSPDGGKFSNAATFTVNTGTVAGASTTKVVAKKAPVKKVAVAKPAPTEVACADTSTFASATDVSDSSGSGGKELTANAFFGVENFMPQNVLGWVLLFVMILMGVVLWRKLYITDKERSVPLKHA